MKKITQKIVLSVLFLAALYPACAGAMKQQKKQLGKPSGKDLQKLCNLLVKKGISAGDVYKHAKGFEGFTNALKNDGQYGPIDKKLNLDEVADQMVSPNIDELNGQKLVKIISSDKSEFQKIQALEAALRTTVTDINSGFEGTWTYGGRTALHAASTYGYLEIVKFLVKNGADIDKKNRDGVFTALLCASIDRKLDVVEFLISNGAKINEKNSMGESALYWATGRKGLEIVKFLIDNGADVNAKDNKGWTPLHKAAWWGKPAIINYLLQHGAKINLENNKGETALHIAAGSWIAHNKFENIKCLVKYGAIIDTKAIELTREPAIKNYLRDTRFRQNMYKTNTNKQLLDLNIK